MRFYFFFPFPLAGEDEDFLASLRREGEGLLLLVAVVAFVTAFFLPDFLGVFPCPAVLCLVRAMLR